MMVEKGSAKAQEPTEIGGVPVYVVKKLSRIALLRQVQGPGAPRDLRLELDEIVIGRSSEAHILIDSSSVSRRHAALLRSDESYVCVDLGSSNGVLVNSKQVTSQVLRDGDSVQIGQALFIYREAVRVPEQPEAP